MKRPDEVDPAPIRSTGPLQPVSLYPRSPAASTPEPLFSTTPNKAPDHVPPLFDDDPLYRAPTARTVRVFMQAKGTGLPIDSEDACAISPDEQCIALCDGTSTSNLPRPWAALLAQHWVRQPFVAAPDTEALATWLTSPREGWKRWVRDTWLPALNARNQRMGMVPLPPGRADDVVTGGASATLLGMRISHAPGVTTWEATAAGDSCLLIFRPADGGWNLERSFPLRHAREFNDRPPTLTSRESNLNNVIGQIGGERGSCQGGEVLIMATDALAKWLLRCIEQEDNRWHEVIDLRDPNRFTALIQEERSAMRLDDDDCTLIIVPIARR